MIYYYLLPLYTEYLKWMHETIIVDFSKFNTENNNDNKCLQKLI